MDKCLILAVAGSGKTSYLVGRLEEGRRTLVLTYTDNNKENLRRKILQKFGHLPPAVRVQTYFQFLTSFCYRPYLARSMGFRGLNFKDPPDFTRRRPMTDDLRFIDSYGRLYHNRIASLLDARGIVPDLLRRLTRYFDALYFDEAQDLAGHDFTLMQSLAAADLETLWVGDFYQRTYPTSVDGNVNTENLHRDFATFCARIEEGGMRVDVETLLHSHRCGASVCAFIRDQVGIEIHSASKRDVQVIEVKDLETAQRLLSCDKTVKLYYQEHHKHGGYSENWGASKGLDHFEDVCVVMNPETEKQFRAGTLRDMKPLSRNRFYVACTRARGDLYLLPSSILKAKKKAAAKKRRPAAPAQGASS